MEFTFDSTYEHLSWTLRKQLSSLQNRWEGSLILDVVNFFMSMLLSQWETTRENKWKDSMSICPWSSVLLMPVRYKYQYFNHVLALGSHTLTQDSFLALHSKIMTGRRRDQMEFERLNPWWPRTRQAPYLLWYCSCVIITIFEGILMISCMWFLLIIIAYKMLSTTYHSWLSIFSFQLSLDKNFLIFAFLILFIWKKFNSSILRFLTYRPFFIFSHLQYLLFPP